MKNYKWAILIACCMMVMGNYYCYDIPAALTSAIRNWMGTSEETHQYQLNFLYSMYSLPNLVSPYIGGILIDKFGTKVPTIVFATLVCIGHVIFTVGLYYKTFWAMIVGRAVLGLGGECLEIVQSQITSIWFRDKHLGLALGLNITFARLASVLNDNVSPIFGEKFGIIMACVLGIGICVFSFLFAVGTSSINASQGYVRLPNEDEEETALEEESALLVEERVATESTEATIENKQSWYPRLPKLPIQFWILCLVFMSSYAVTLPFVHISSQFYQDKYFENDPVTAGTYLSVPDFVAAIFTPLCGILVDKLSLQKGAYLIPFATLSLLAIHALFGFTMLHPLALCILFGLSSSLLISSIWPIIPKLAPPQHLGAAYGVMGVIMNITLALFPLVIASVKNYFQSWASVQVLFIITCAVGTLVSLMFISFLRNF